MALSFLISLLRFAFPSFFLDLLHFWLLNSHTVISTLSSSKLFLHSFYLPAVPQPPATMLITPPCLFSPLLFRPVTLGDAAAFAASVLLGSAVEMRGCGGGGVDLCIVQQQMASKHGLIDTD